MINPEITIFLATNLDRIVILSVVLYFIVLFIFSENKKRIFSDFVFCFISATIALAISMLIKEAFMIERPFVSSGVEPLFLPFDPYSFPSSHSAVFFAISACLFFIKKKIWVLFFVASFFIATARVLSGVHTFYDCFVGGLLGIFISYIIYKALTKFFKL
jgi:undecaprenyl-diphosphatase